MKKKEIGIPKNAPAAAKKADDKLDKAKGLKEGSKADLAADKLTMAQFTKPAGPRKTAAQHTGSIMASKAQRAKK